MSSAVTRDILVEVRSSYVPARSSPHKNFFFFAYHVTIANRGKEPVQLMGRHWVVTDGKGHTEEVHGPGVVGQQPRLLPGEQFSYTSFCPLHTQVGSMHGTFDMQSEAGVPFGVRIAPFTLALPHALN
jgi:ApaG protein